MTAQIVHPVDRNLNLRQRVKAQIIITLEVLAVFALMLVLRVAMRTIGIYQWEKENLGGVYTVMLLWIGLTALVISLSRRSWSEFGVSSAQWPNNLDIGINRNPVRGRAGHGLVYVWPPTCGR